MASRFRQRLDDLVERLSNRVDGMGEKYILPYRQAIAYAVGGGILALEGYDSVKSLIQSGNVEAWPLISGMGVAWVAYIFTKGDLNHWNNKIQHRKDLADPVTGRITGGSLIKRMEECEEEEAEQASRSWWERTKRKLAKFATDPGEVYFGWEYGRRVKKEFNQTLFPHACYTLGIPLDAADEKTSKADLQTGVYTIEYEEGTERKKARINLPNLVDKLRDAPEGRLGLRCMRPALYTNFDLQRKELGEPPQTIQLAAKTGVGLALAVGFVYAANQLGMDLHWASAIIPGGVLGWALGSAVQGFAEYGKERFVHHREEKERQGKSREVIEKEQDFATLLERVIAKKEGKRVRTNVDPNLVYVFDSPISGEGRVYYSLLWEADGTTDLQNTIRHIKPEELKRDYLEGLSPEEFLRKYDADLLSIRHGREVDRLGVEHELVLRKLQQ